MSDPTIDAPPRLPVSGDVADRYLGLLRGCLTRELFFGEEVVDVLPAQSWPYGDVDEFWAFLETNGWRLVYTNTAREDRHEGRDYPPHAETMMGAARLANVQELATRVLVERVPGDFVETGVWRGGAIILMRAVLDVYGDDARRVWACDSFQGLPEPDSERFPADESMRVHDGVVRHLMNKVLAVPADQVRANIARYGLLDDRIRFVEGWFRDTLPSAPIEEIALLRLDGDLYESTMDALVHLEPKLSPGGFVIVDDYNSVEPCKLAVDEYRAEHGIDAPIHEVDWTGAWWQKPSA